MKKITNVYEAENMARTLEDFWTNKEDTAKANYYKGIAEALRWVNDGVNNKYNTPLYNEEEYIITQIW